MKKFLSKSQACETLNKLITQNTLSHEDSVALASIRVCLIADDMNLSLWGKSVEDARPIFRDCEVPTPQSSEDIIKNYEIYKKCLAEKIEKYTRKNEVSCG